MHQQLEEIRGGGGGWGVFLAPGNVFECPVAALDLRHGRMDGPKGEVEGRRHTRR